MPYVGDRPECICPRNLCPIHFPSGAPLGSDKVPLTHDIVELRKEVIRLRAALEVIAEGEVAEYNKSEIYQPDGCGCSDCVQDFARKSILGK